VRGSFAWILAIVAGIALVLVVTALIGNRDDSGETVPAGAWAQSVCGAVGVWRGELEAIVEDIRTPSATPPAGSEEPQSETPQGRRGFVRSGLERAVQATETMVEGVENAGIPESAQGEEVAEQISDWADSSLATLEDAEDSLEEEADSLEGSIEQLTGAAAAIGTVLVSGFETLAGVATADPEVAAALNESSTCQQLREEQSET
jgi:hypothetical protein